MKYSYNKKRDLFYYIIFIFTDLLSMEISLLLSYSLRHGFNFPYENKIYRIMAIILIIIYFSILFFNQAFKNILNRGYLEESINVIFTSCITTLLFMLYTFMSHTSEEYSRITVILFTVSFTILLYTTRIFVKELIKLHSKYRVNSRSMILITTKRQAVKIFSKNKKKNEFINNKITGIIIIDEDMKGMSIHGIPVVSNRYGIKSYLLLNWVDEVFMLGDDGFLSEFIDDEIELICEKIGVTFHKSIYNKQLDKNLTINNIFGYTVITHNIVDMTLRDAVLKRIMDIFGGIVGCLITAIFIIVIGPIIYLSSPGNIFFSQYRVGRNGKTFKIYKFRSMYMDAEERKSELMKQNKVKDGMMFKMDNDPRIIKGIGNFIRKTSIDEFPQFLNVLKGDMSLVGTRPPTVDEYQKYDLHHKKRLAIKPGLTGMWQISGRSNITDFEDVVKLDTKYISTFSLKQDIKIILITILVILKREGSS